MNDQDMFQATLEEMEWLIETFKHLSEDRVIDVSSVLKELEQQRSVMFQSMEAWDRIKIARHPDRPLAYEYIEALFDDFVPLHGDRAFADDKAIVGGMAIFKNQPCMVIGQHKGKNTSDRIHYNFGMPQPDGYRKAIRLLELAARFHKPVFVFIDTPGAYPGIGAEERGQAEAIARNMEIMSRLATPIIVTVLGEGGSGGALGIGVGDRVLILENAYYSVITPEGCAAILWRDAAMAPAAAKALKISAQDLLSLEVIDEIIKEPPGGAHRAPDEQFPLVAEVLQRNLEELSQIAPEDLVQQRYEKFRKMGRIS